LPTPMKTVRDAADTWLRRCEREDLDTQTIYTYRGQVTKHILPRLGDRELVELTRSDIRDFLDDLLDDVSREMARKVLVSLKSLLKEAVQRDWIAASPAVDVTLKRQRRHDKAAEIPTKQEIKALIDHAPPRHRPLIVTAIFTGMRISELLGLAWKHVDFERRVIRVRQRANRKLEIGSPKSAAGRRDIPMSPVVHEVLRDWQAECPHGALDLVFPNGKGNIENYGNLLRRVFKPLQVDTGIVDASGEAKYAFHALRHAAASLMIEQGWSPKKIQCFLGHSSITMTYDVYGHLFTKAEDDLALFEKMESDLFTATAA